MKTLIVALVMCLAAPAFAQDMGTKHTAVKQEKCNGVELTLNEARGFTVNYDVLIVISTQIVPPTSVASDEDQKVIVATLKKLDEIANSDKPTGCLVATPEDVKLLVDTGAKMIDIELRAKAESVHVKFVLSIAKGDEKLARLWADGLAKAAHKLGAYGDAASGVSL